MVQQEKVGQGAFSVVSRSVGGPLIKRPRSAPMNIRIH